MDNKMLEKVNRLSYIVLPILYMGRGRLGLVEFFRSYYVYALVLGILAVAFATSSILLKKNLLERKVVMQNSVIIVISAVYILLGALGVDMSVIGHHILTAYLWGIIFYLGFNKDTKINSHTLIYAVLTILEMLR